MNRHRPSDHGRVMGDGGSTGVHAPVEPAGFTDGLGWWDVWHRKGTLPWWVVRHAFGVSCGAHDPVSGLMCMKRPGHHLFTDRRRWHRAEERNEGRIGETYPATWVHLWTSVRSVTTTERNHGE